MEVIEKKITDIRPYERNPRINDDAVGAVMNSIKEFGWQQPIVVDQDGVIIVGHTRYKAAKKLKLKTVPVVVAELSEEQARAYRIADNSTNGLATWDYDLLLPELEGLSYDMADFGLDLTSTEDDEGDLDPDDIIEDDYEIPEEVEPQVKLGEVWRCGEHVLLCGDATSEADVDKLIKAGGGGVDLVLTDPPYGISIVTVKSPKDDDKTGKKGTVGGGGPTHFKGTVGGGCIVPASEYYPVIGDDTTETAEKSYKVLKKVCDKLILWGGNYFTDFLDQSDGWIIWDKRNDGVSNNFADGEMAWCSFHTPLRIFRQVWMGMVREGESGKRVHPTQKPVRTLAQIIDKFSDKGTVVMDVFGGSGSTMIACEQTDRQCLMMELDPHYCDVIINRWEQFTGKQAEKVVG